MKDSNKQIIVYAVGIGAGYFLIVKPILEALGILKDDAQKAKEAAEQKNADQQIKDLQKRVCD
jgi:hypothetical protein